MSKFGYTNSEWEKGRAEITQILRTVASSRGMITYGELTDQLRTIRIDPHSDAMGQILGEISTDEDAAGRGMLSVIVVHKHGDMEPGTGFYRLAAARGKNMSDKVKLWVSELHKVHNQWANAN
jgi:hypothetical protein